MLSTTPTAIPAQAGYEVVSLDATGEVQRWPIIAWGLVPHYGYGDGGSIMPIALGIVFDGDAHGIVMPDGRTLTTAGGMARWYRDSKVWASAVSEVRALRAWHQAGVQA
jgi:hypothetical protein